MPDVFISYSRRDTPFVHVLVGDLERHGKTVWLDTEGIRDAEVFPDAIRAAIDASDTFVFVITPASVASLYCGVEVEHAVSEHKRIIPVLHRPVPDETLPEAIRIRNWIPFTPDVEEEEATTRLLVALETDLDHVQSHTRWLVKALEWERERRDRAFLLRGAELRAAESWLGGVGEGTEPAPTVLQREYVVASRTAASRRQRTLVIASLSVAVVSLALLVFALVSRTQAISARAKAEAETKVVKSQALAAAGESQLPIDSERSILLAMAAVRSSPTPEAMYDLRLAIDTSPVRARLASVGTEVAFSGPAIAWSPDGRFVAEGSDAGYVAIFDSASGRLVRRIQAGSAAPTVGWSPHGSQVLVGDAKDLRLVDASTGTTLRVDSSIVGSAPGNFAFAPDGSTAYFANGQNILAWDLGTGRTNVVATVAGLGGVGAGGGVYWVALTPDGHRLAVGGFGIAVVDVVTGHTLATAALDNFVTGLAFSSDGLELAAVEDAGGNAGFNAGSVVVLDAHSLALRSTLERASTVSFATVAFSPDAAMVAFGGTDGFVGVDDARTGRRVVSLPGATSLINEVAFSPDGRELATAAQDGNAVIWQVGDDAGLTVDAGGLDPAVGGSNYYADLVFTAGSIMARLAPTSGPEAGHVVVDAWSLQGGQTAAPLELGHASVYAGVGLSADGRFAASLSVSNQVSTNSVSIWDVTKRQVVRTLAVTAGNRSPVWSPDDSRLALAGPVTPSGAPKTLEVVDLRTGQTRQLGDGNWVAWYAFSPDSRLLALVDGVGHLDVWDVTTGRLVGPEVSFGTITNLGPLAFSPDGKYLAVANTANEGQVSILQIPSEQVVSELTDHTRQVNGIAYSPDGRLLATASLDGTARIWDARTALPLRVINHPDGVNNVMFSPNSVQVATLDLAGVLRVWDACTDCENPAALLALAQTRVTRQLTTEERRAFNVG